MAKKKQPKKIDLDKVNLEGIIDPDAPAGDMPPEISNPENNGLVSGEEAAELGQDYQLEQKYGDDEIEAALLGAARGLSFGVSDHALKKAGLYSEEALRELKQRNQISSIAGEIAGVAAPTFLTGGLGAAGAGVKGAARAGAATEKLVAKALTSAATKSGNKKLAKEIVTKGLSKGAGSAVEASFYGTGQLVSENALGNAEFNAENLAASAGNAALFGGAAGGIFGVTSKIIPKLKNGKIADFVEKKFKSNIDDVSAAQNLQGMTPTQIAKQNERFPAIAQNTPKYLRKVAKEKGVKAFSGNKKLLQTVIKDFDTLGKRIGNTIKKVDDLADIGSVLPSKSSVAKNIQNRLFKLADDYRGLKTPSAKQNLNRIQRAIKSFDEDVMDNSVISARELDDLKQKYQKLANWDKRGQLALDEQINREVARQVREEVLTLADRVSTQDRQLGTQLREQLLDYGTATEFISNLSKKIEAQESKSFFSWRDYLIAGGTIGTDIAATGGASIAARKLLQSDLRRRFVILNKIEKANREVNKKISSGISGFINNFKKAAKPAAQVSLAKISYAVDDKKPKKRDETKRESFKRIAQEIQDLANTPEKLTTYTADNTLSSTGAAPQTAAALQQTTTRMLSFLNQKLPVQMNAETTFQILKNRWEPSDADLTKFERYIQTISNPTSVVEELQQGTLTRDHVEALRAVYPNMYQKIQQETIEQIAQEPEKLSYQQRLYLGVLLNIPADISLTPENMQALQAKFNTQEANRQPTLRRSANLDKAQRELTPLQRAQRK